MDCKPLTCTGIYTKEAKSTFNISRMEEPASLRSFIIKQKQNLSARNKTVKNKNHITRSAKINKLHTCISLNSSWKSRRVLSPRSSVDRNLVLFNWMPMMLFSRKRLCSRCTKLTSSFGRLKLTYQ